MVSRPAASRATTWSAASRGLPAYINELESFIASLPEGWGDRSNCDSTTVTMSRTCDLVEGDPVDSVDGAKYRVAVIGGTGPQGKGLGYRFAKGGHTVVLGSRAAEKGEAVADE